MLRKLIAALCLCVLLACPADAVTGTRRVLVGGSIPAWVTPGAVIDMNFATGQYFGCTPATCLSLTRALSETNLLPSSPSGFAYTTYGNNQFAFTANGPVIFGTRTNQLLNSTAPATQTTGALAATAQTLWVNGSGSAALSNGTATGCAGTATNGSPVTFTPTAGTCTVTVTGSLNAEQLEAGSYGTPLIVTAGAPVTRPNDATIATGILATILSSTQGTLVAQVGAFPGGASVLNGGGVFGSANATLQRYPFNSTDLQTFNGGVGLRVNIGSSAFAAPLRLGVAWSPAGRSVAGNNVLATDANTISLPSTNIGSMGAGGNYLDTTLQRLTVFSTRLTDAQFKALTQ